MIEDNIHAMHRIEQNREVFVREIIPGYGRCCGSGCSWYPQMKEGKDINVHRGGENCFSNPDQRKEFVRSLESRIEMRLLLLQQVGHTVSSSRAEGSCNLLSM